MPTVCFLIGLILGVTITTCVLCCLQINRINDLEEEIRRLNRGK